MITLEPLILVNLIKLKFYGLITIITIPTCTCAQNQHKHLIKTVNINLLF